mmetsp:Transcript_20108/g.27935  ORF Transcript_20108/g.27935 Transcript_20108/m.27935 type:complete len:268 (-) Transcript_20108:219-1022(-)
MASPKSNKSSKKFTKTTHSQNLYKDNFDSGPALLNRLKEELSSITQDKVDPMTKSIQTSYLNKQLGEIYKRRQNCVDKERALTQKLKELLRNKVEEADEKVKLVQRIVTVSAQPGYIEYPEEKKQDTEDVQKLTNELENLQREIENMDLEAMKLRKDSKNKQEKYTGDLNRHCQRIHDARTGKTSPKNKTKGSSNDVNTQVTSFRQWFSDYGKPNLKGSKESPMLSTFQPSRTRLKNYGIGDNGKQERTTGNTSKGVRLKPGKILSS